MFEDNSDESVYNIDQYSDKELINKILDLNNPTDRELEAKIVMMINKYENNDTKLSKFFEDIYSRFFEIEEEDEEEDYSSDEEGNIKEGLETMNEKYSDASKKGLLKEKKEINLSDQSVKAKANFIKSAGNTISAPGFESAEKEINNKVSPWNDTDTSNTRVVEYKSGWINPLTKETIKRVIYLDSQYRDKSVYPLSTDYTFNLSDSLQDVLTIRLHAINIPYSWYTVANSRGANYFVLKGIAPGINDGSRDIKVSITPGNYATATNLVDVVNTAIKDLPKTYPDVSFNDSGLTYDDITGLCTLNLSLTATYTLSKIIFPRTTNPFDKDIVRLKSIPGYLGFYNNEYESSVLYSNSLHSKEKTLVSTPKKSQIRHVPIELYKYDVFTLYEDGEHKNNFFTIKVVNDETGKIIDEIIVTLLPPVSPFKKSSDSPRQFSRETLLNLTNTALQSNKKLSNKSKIELIDMEYYDSNNTLHTHQTYKLTIELNRNEILHIEEMEEYIMFPEETTPFPIWTGLYSCFMFDTSYKQELYKPLNIIESDSTPIEMNYNIYSNPYVVLNCIVDPSYSYIVNIPNSPRDGYTKEEYISVLNNAFQEQSINFDIELNVLISEDVLSNRVHFIVQIYKNIDEFTNITELDYQFEFFDSSGCYVELNGNECTSWKYYLGLTNKIYLFSNVINKDYSEFYANTPIRDVEITITDENKNIDIQQNGAITSIYVPTGSYTKTGLISALNKEFSLNTVTKNLKISKTLNKHNKTKTIIKLKATTTYTTKDYEIVFYDVLTKGSCNTGLKGNKSITHTTWDFVLGWSLGFRGLPTYFMDPKLYPNGNPKGLTINTTTNPYKVTLVGNTAITVDLITQCFIVIDDFTQNHLNDGVITMSGPDKLIPLPSYANKATFRCDPTTAKEVPSLTNSDTNALLTQRQIYASQQINNNSTNRLEYYSHPPYVKDLFALVPLKIPTNQGDSFVEYGGTLQDNNRIYFGPVNIKRFRVQLLTDRGDVIDLNGRDWTFSIICETLYTANKNDKK